MSDRLWVGTRKGLFRIERDASAQWQISQTWFLGDPVSMLLPLTENRGVLAALDLGHFGVKLRRSNDDGLSWHEVPVPSYPQKPEDIEDKDPMRGIEIPWSTKLIWALESGTADELWCGTIPGGLFHSIDDGASWELNRPLWDDPGRREWMGGGYDFAGIHSILIDPRDPRHLTLGVSVGGVWTTDNGGADWRLIGQGLRNAYMPPELADNPVSQDVHRLAHFRAKPERVWMQHHNGIFCSDDGGEHWQEIAQIKPSTFGFAVAAHPTDPDTAWFVPAVKDEQRIPVDGRLVVTRTRDGGQSFEVFSKGLPDRHAYDLIYRHGLDIAPDGERLAFGSTTGSLWISEDQGESWQTAAEHLPPVACVRFDP